MNKGPAVCAVNTKESNWAGHCDYGKEFRFILGEIGATYMVLSEVVTLISFAVRESPWGCV